MRAEMPEPVFYARDLTYSYRQIPALTGINLTIERGERVALLGANGSGKTTLLRILDGLYPPSGGSLRFSGQDLTFEKLAAESFELDFRRQVALVFQNPDVQLFNATVFDELAFGPLQLRWPKEEIQARVAETMEQMRLDHLRDRPPHHLSGGEQKRVALASVLILDPVVLLLDEPTMGLDPRSQSQIIDLLVGWGGGAKTIVSATHDLGIVPDIADRCIILQDGKVVAEGSPDEILHNTELLRSTSLIHSHRHHHASGEVHTHPHVHRPGDWIAGK
jgi:cobalt/nickel transport system ATP-binding protein